MPNKRTELLQWTKHFIELCEQNDIWYSADLETLLGTQRHGGFVPWEERVQVMMTPESYKKMSRIVPENIIDRSFDVKYKSLKPSFVENRKEWRKDQPFVEIRIVVPTTIRQIKEFRNPFRRISSVLTNRKDNTKVAINDLLAVRFEGFYTVTTRFSSANYNWIPNLTMEREMFKFNTVNMAVIKEYKDVLINLYGENYMKAIMPTKTYSYPAPCKVIREDE